MSGYRVRWDRVFCYALASVLLLFATDPLHLDFVRVWALNMALIFCAPPWLVRHQ